MAAVEFTTSAFERSHGAAPRGRGSWGFRASATPMAFDRDLSGEPVFFHGTLGEAKAKLRESGALAGAAFVAVLP